MNRNTYKIKLYDPSQRDRVEDCLQTLDLNVIRDEEEDGYLCLYAAGYSDMTPSQLQGELKGMGCENVGVTDQFQDVRKMGRSDIQTPNDDVAMAPNVGHDPEDFDVNLANRFLAQANSLIDVDNFHRQGDAMQDKASQGRDIQSYRKKGRGGNKRPGYQSYQSYLQQCRADVVDETGLTPEEADEVIRQCQNHLERKGKLPENPGRDPEHATDKEFSEWTGAAKAINFGSYCIKYATQR